MKTNTHCPTAKSLNPFDNTTFKHLGLIGMILCLVSYHQSAAQQFSPLPLTHPDGIFIPQDLNNLAQIAGTLSVDDTTYHAVRREQDGQFTNLPEMGGNLSQAYCMNELGEVAGVTVDEDGYGHTVVWENSGFRELEVPSDAATLPIPLDINNEGTVTGRYTNTGGMLHALVWDTTGVVQLLPEDAGIQSSPAAINDSGVIVGTVFLADVTPRAYRWQPGGIAKSLSSTQLTEYATLDLGTLGGTGAQASDINNQGQVVGFANISPDSSTVHAFVWQDSVMFDLGTLGGNNSVATSINDDGIIVGRSELGDSALTKSALPGHQQSIMGHDVTDPRTGFKLIQTPSSILMDAQDGEHDAWWLRMRGMGDMEWAMHNFEDNMNGSMGIDFDDAWSNNLDRGCLIWDFESGFYFNRSNIVYLNPAATGGMAGFHSTPYGSYNSAVADDTQVPPAKIYWGSGMFPGDVNIPSDTKQYFGSYSGLGPDLRHNPPHISVEVYGRFNVDLGSSVTINGGTDNTWTYGQDVRIFGRLSFGSLMNLNFRQNLTVGPESSMLIDSHRDAVNLVNFDQGSMGEGTIRLKGPGTTQINLGADFLANLKVDKKKKSQLLIDTRGHQISNLLLDRGTLELLSDVTLNETANLELKKGRITSLLGRKLTIMNPNPLAILGGSDKAFIRIPLVRYLGIGGNYGFPVGDFKCSNPLSLNFGKDIETGASVGVQYVHLDDHHIFDKDLWANVPRLERTLELDVTYPYAWKVSRQGEVSENPDIELEPRNVQNFKFKFSFHMIQVDLTTGTMSLAGEDPSLIENSFIDSVPRVFQPGVILKDSFLLGIATNRFLNPIDKPDSLVNVDVQFVNLADGSSTMDTYINDTNIHYPLAYQEATPFGAISPGNVPVDLADTSDQDNSLPVYSQDIAFAENKSYHVIFSGMDGNLNFFIDSNAEREAADSDKVDIKIFHDHPDIGLLTITPLVNDDQIYDDIQIEYADFSERKSILPGLLKLTVLDSAIRFDLSERAKESLLIIITPHLINRNEALKSSEENDFDLVIFDALGLKVEPTEGTTAVASMPVPAGFALHANYPNPFDHGTKISYVLPRASWVRLTIKDVLGRQVRTLVDGNRPGGKHTVEWDGRDELGNDLPAGMYLYRLEANGFVQTRNMMRLK